MYYSDLISKLFAVNLFGGIKLGLQNSLKLQELLHYPDRSFTAIHVAGTNGKGSVSTKIAHAFEKGGYRVGLYTSPHISSFRERIRIDGQMISESDVESLLPFLFEVAEAEKIPATFFELTTLLAFLYFAQKKVEIAVLETGLGGRLDATNIVSPCLSIITSISLDHTEILGATREAIALEKAGIIKEHIPVIIGPHVPLEIIQTAADRKQSPCIQVKCASPLFEEENRQIARTALNYLASSFHISDEAIEKGLAGRQPCRFEVLEGSPRIILDVAHNPDGLQHLLQMLTHEYPGKPLRFLFGLSKNKDLKGCLNLLGSHGTHFHLVEACNGRGASARDLFAHLSELGIQDSRLSIHESIGEGISKAQQEALVRGEILVICGSFFIMSEARQALGFTEPYDRIDLNERHVMATPLSWP